MADLDPAAVMTALTNDQRLRAFVRNGRIAALPARRSRRLRLLDTIAQGFEPGLRYPERSVNQFLGALHADHAALRRYLVDGASCPALTASTGALAGPWVTANDR